MSAFSYMFIFCLFMVGYLPVYIECALHSDMCVVFIMCFIMWRELHSVPATARSCPAHRHTGKLKPAGFAESLPSVLIYVRLLTLY